MTERSSANSSRDNFLRALLQRIVNTGFYQKAAAGLMLIQLLMLCWIAVWNAPVCDEVGHLTAGIYGWRFGHFQIYRVNPPLVKLVAAIPAAFGNPKVDWRHAAETASSRPEFEIGQDFIAANRPHGTWYFTAGRLLCLPFTTLGGWMCFLWGRSLYGPRSGLIACLLWCLSPMVLGWGATFTPDSAAASFGLLAAYTYRRWLNTGTWQSAFLAGLGFGVCQLTKMTWIVLFPIWPLLWFVFYTLAGPKRRPLRTELGQLALIFFLGLYVMNVGYGFEGTGRKLGDYDFLSSAMTGNKQSGTVGNRFHGTVLADIPIPLPYNYIRGIDLQKVDFERGMSSYLFGTWSDRGWWYYYPVAACLKLPLGMLLLGLIAVVCHAIPRTGMKFTRDELVLLVPAIVVFVLVCSQTGFGRYIRYLLPSLPAVFILISKLWTAAIGLWVARVCWSLLVWSVVSCLLVYPHCISYFNELAGGPVGGHRYLLDANIDWGQDLIRFKSWMEQHPEARPMFCASMGFVSPNDIGIDSRWPPKVPPSNGDKQTEFTPPPGWYAVSVHELFERHGCYNYLQKYEPVDRVGYSIWIYRIE